MKGFLLGLIIGLITIPIIVEYKDTPIILIGYILSVILLYVGYKYYSKKNRDN